MPLYIHVFQSVAANGAAGFTFDSAGGFCNVADALEEADPMSPDWRYLHTLEHDPKRGTTRTLSRADLDAILREQEADRALEEQHERGLRSQWRVA